MLHFHAHLKLLFLGWKMQRKRFSFVNVFVRFAYMRTEAQCSLLPSTDIDSFEGNIFRLREHTISESFSLHDDVEVFPLFFLFPSLRSLSDSKNNKWQKIKELCNIFIKIFALACSIHDGAKSFFATLCKNLEGN